MARAQQRESFRGRLSGLPLRYRLCIPFFFLAFLGTFSLVGLAILSQNKIISKEENDRLFSYFRALHHNLEVQGRWAVSLASSFARNPEITEALAEKDRMRLIQLCYPWYLFMKQHYGISQFNFHTLPPRNFLRFQRLYEFGDDLSYRQTIVDAVAREGETFGLEKGLTGYGIRGVAPVFYQGEMVGVVEIGFNFGLVFLDDMKQQFDIEASFLVPDGNHTIFTSLATTFPHHIVRTDPVYAQVFKERRPEVILREIPGGPYALLLGTIEDYGQDGSAGGTVYEANRNPEPRCTLPRTDAGAGNLRNDPVGLGNICHQQVFHRTHRPDDRLCRSHCRGQQGRPPGRSPPRGTRDPRGRP